MLHTPHGFWIIQIRFEFEEDTGDRELEGPRDYVLKAQKEKFLPR